MATLRLPGETIREPNSVLVTNPVAQDKVNLVAARAKEGVFVMRFGSHHGAQSNIEHIAPEAIPVCPWPLHWSRFKYRCWHNSHPLAQYSFLHTHWSENPAVHNLSSQ